MLLENEAITRIWGCKEVKEVKTHETRGKDKTERKGKGEGRK
jgi:hypothetical protein